jgi:pimeloyl-ACP methyl ester carboxylesterase
MWDGQIPALRQTCRVIAPDLRGFGKSGATPGKVTVEQHAADLAAMLDALAVAEPVVLVGLSMGGYIVLQFYRNWPQRVKAIVVCDSRAAADSPGVVTGRLETADRVERDGPQCLADSMTPRLLAPQTYQAHPEVVDRLRRMILAGNAAGQAASSRGMAERGDFTPLLPEIDCPALLIVGQRDGISTPIEMGSMARAVRGATLVEIEGAGHMTPMEKPAEVAHALAEFLAELA